MQKSEIIFLPAPDLNFEEALISNGFVEIENKTNYPSLIFVKDIKKKEFFWAAYPMWHDHDLRLIKLEGKPDQNFSPFEIK